MRDPLWRDEDLGYAIPDSVHGVSVALPRWEHVIGYEEKDPAVIGRMHCGYPRFYCHPYLQELFAAGEARFAEAGEKALLFPSPGAAERCCRYLADRAGAQGRIEAFGAGGLYVVLFPEAVVETALKFWQHCGEITSSRQAGAALGKADPGTEGTAEEGAVAERKIRERLAEWSGQRVEDVHLFQTGMAAVFAVHRALQRLHPGRKCAQLEFPYVDVLKIQEQFGAGVHFLGLDDRGGLGELKALLEQEELCGVYCELASNPLLRSVDVAGLADILSKRAIPLVADDTVGSVHNIDAFAGADLVTTSLTKYFSGTGDVMGGSVILRSDSAFHASLSRFFHEETDGGLWVGDALALEKNSRDYRDRIQALNRNGEAMFEYLESHPKVNQVWYPKNRTRDLYEKIRRPGGGYGALVSILLRDAAKVSAPFYDALRLSKGPSLGTNFSLACPYTLLAHYHELNWAEEHGVSRHLIRISVGLEDFEDLRGRFEEAFAAC